MVHPATLVLARLKREPLADLPIADALDQAAHRLGHRWRERLLTPLVMVRLMLIQIMAANCPVPALRQVSGVNFVPSSYSEARDRLGYGKGAVGYGKGAVGYGKGAVGYGKGAVGYGKGAGYGKGGYGKGAGQLRKRCQPRMALPEVVTNG